MKILAIGDFNGVFPRKYAKIIKKEKIDLVVVDGDYPPFSLKKEFFKYVYRLKDIELWEFVGKKKYKEAVIRDHKKGEEVMKKLNKISVPVFSSLGNHDHSIPDDVSDVKKPKGKKFWKWEWDRHTYLARVMKKYKNITKIDYSYAKFKGFVFIGARGHSYPGRVKSKAYKRHRKILEKLFKKFSKENKKRKVIFVTHVSPYNTKLDLITAKDAHRLAKGKHYGSKLFRRIIDKYQPVLSISGHFDESRGKQKIRRTLAVNAGPVHKGEGAIITLPEKKGKIKVKFIK
jgi:Icc-related predicted phosphoesterase